MNAIDMSEFEAEFEQVNSEDLDEETFERLAFLRDRMSDLDQTVAFRRDVISEIDAQVNELREFQRKLDELIRQLREERIPFETEKDGHRRENRRDEKKFEEYKREYARIMADIQARRRMRLERHIVEDAVKEAPWMVGIDGKKALPHQLDGAHSLVASERAILGDKPGLGKTLQAIMTVDMLRAKGKSQKILILTPKPVLPGFEAEYKKWSPNTLVHNLDEKGKGVRSAILDFVVHLPEVVIITNYEAWRRDKSIHDKLIQCQFDTVILDEAHYLKNQESITFKRVREIVYAANKCTNCKEDPGNEGACTKCFTRAKDIGAFCSVKQVYPMTGTAILNKPQELWPLLNLIDRVAFPRESKFLWDFCQQKFGDNDTMYWTFKSGGVERLLRSLKSRYIGRSRESAGVIMPPQEVKHHWLELDEEKYPRQAHFVQQLKEKARLVFSDDHEMILPYVLQWYTRMRQAASWPDAIQIHACPHEPECVDPVTDKPNCKNKKKIFPPEGAPPIGESVMMDAAEDIVREAVESGERIVVFTFYREVISELERRCNSFGARVARIDGSVPDSKRRAAINDFDTKITKVGEHNFDVLICQYQTASEGVNLQGANQILLYERQWNPGKEEQAMDRLRRIDSEMDSTVHILHCEGTATDLIDTIIEQKSGMLEDFETEANLHDAMKKFLEG